MSKKMYQKGRAVTGISDFIVLANLNKRFIKDYGSTDPGYVARHPRCEQAQTAAFMLAQQFWTIQRLIERNQLFVADRIEPIVSEPKEVQ